MKDLFKGRKPSVPLGILDIACDDGETVTIPRERFEALLETEVLLHVVERLLNTGEHYMDVENIRRILFIEDKTEKEEE